MNRPEKNEYGPYFEKYIGLVPNGDFMKLLDENTTETVQFFGSISQDKADFSYSAGKWTIKEMLQHIVDTERVMAYRALVIGRGDTSSAMPSMDQEIFAKGADVSKRTIPDLLEEFVAIRQSTVKLFKNLSEEKSRLIGNVPANPFSPRALGYIIIGHIKHHFNIAVEKYGITE